MPRTIDTTFMDAARATRAPAGRRRPGLRPAPGPDRRRALRAARRGVARHARVLPRARRDHPAADRGEGLHRRRGRGRLARRLPRQPLRARHERRRRSPSTRSPTSSASPPGCGATPTCSSSSSGCARTTTRCPTDAKVGFYGLDLYSLHASIEAVLRYLEKVDPEAAQRARARYACFDHFGDDPQAYGFATGLGLAKSCEDEVVSQLVELQRRAMAYARRDGRVAEDEFFYAEQNARLVKNAEAYYRSMFLGEVSSWNLRDRHMAETLDALVAHLDRQARAREGRRLGAQLAPGRRARDRDGPARRAERRPARARAVRPRRGAGRLHHAPRHRHRRLRLGRRRPSASASGPRSPGSYEARVPRHRARLASCSPGDDVDDSGARPCASRGSSARSA